MWCPGLIASLLVLAAPSTGPDAGTLVAKLGSARYIEREEAARALLARGVAVIPTLREARNSSDAELRARAAALIDSIEQAALVAPTRVALDFIDRPLPEIAKRLAERSRIPVTLDNDRQEIWPTRRATLTAGEPVPFWEAVDRLCEAAGLRVDLGPVEQPGANSLPVGIRLSEFQGKKRAPTSTHGPFRVKVLSVHHQRERFFDIAADEQDSDEQFYVQLQVMAEPRLIIGQSGNLKVIEAVDDLGQSLKLPGGSPREEEEGGLDRFEFNGGVALHAPVALRRPAAAGRSIGRLKGTLPLIVAARREQPLDVPLDGAVGKAFLGEEVILTVHAIRTDPNEPQPTYEIGLRPRPGSRRDGMAIRSPLRPSLIGQQVEILDAKGRSITTFSQETSAEGDETRLNVLLAPTEGTGAPSRLLYYGMTTARAEVPFEFAGVPMP